MRVSIEHRGPGDWVFAALGTNVAIGTPAYALGFLFSYFMNDIPGTADHVAFIAFGVVTAIASTVVVGVLSGAAGRAVRAPTIAAWTSVAVNGTFLAGFFALTAGSFGVDTDYFPGAMSTDGVYGLAIASGVIALCAVVATVKTSRSGSRPPTAAAPSWRA